MKWLKIQCFIYHIKTSSWENSHNRNHVIILQGEKSLGNFSALEDWMEKGRDSVHERREKITKEKLKGEKWQPPAQLLPQIWVYWKVPEREPCAFDEEETCKHYIVSFCFQMEKISHSNLSFSQLQRVEEWFRTWLRDYSVAQHSLVPTSVCMENWEISSSQK